MATKVLLLEDVDVLGRSGDIVNVKPGYARNFLLPQGLAMVADKQALMLQEKLQEERKKKAVVEKRESEAVATRIEGVTLVKVVKVDHEGHMYGSVATSDIVHLLNDELKLELERRSIQLKHPIKATGVHTIIVKLKEGVQASFNLKVVSEEGEKAMTEEPAPAPAPQEA